MRSNYYDKAIIYYFSGTGNAKNCAIWIEQELKNLAIPVEIFDISKLNPNISINFGEKKTLIGFCSPTHGFDFPLIMRRFIWRFPKVKNCDAFILNTRAGTRVGNTVLPGLTGVIHYKNSFILMAKGFSIVGLYPVDLPSNWISLHPSLKKTGIDIIYEKIEPKVRDFAKKIATGGKNFRALYDLIQDVLISPISLGYSFIGKYILSKSFYASYRCDNCGICIKNCPIKAIKELNGRVFWSYKCESCMRCMNECPKNAIQSSHMFLFIFFLFYYLAYDKIFGKIFSNLNGFLDFMIFSILSIPAIILGYRLNHYLLKVRVINRFITFLSLTNLKFWGRYKSPKVKK